MKSCPTCRGTYPTHFSVCPQDGSALQSTTELSPGAVIREKYQILSKLGAGGMGVVYKAQHLHFKEVCALKLVSAGLAQDPTFVQRFNSEALLMRKLDHPHALRVHDIDKTEDGQPFIVMEFVEGSDLATLLRDGPLEPVRAARIVMQACDALSAAHRLGIIHRDIKPTNFMVSRTPEGGDHVKVFDFGIAKVKEGSPLHGGASLTQTGMVVGTPAYMSPEQCMGARGDKLDGRTDLYSLGIVLYEALTGRVPFSGETPMSLVLAHIQQAPADPRTIRAELPPALAEVVLRALEKDPANRFASAEEMRDTLQAILEAEEISLDGTVRVMPRRTPAPPRVPSAAPPRTAPAAAAPTDRILTPPPAPVSSPGAPPVAPPVVERAPEPPPRPAAPVRSARPAWEEAPQPARRSYLGVVIVLAVLLVGGIGYVLWDRSDPAEIPDGLHRPPIEPAKKPEETQKAAEPPASSSPARPAKKTPVDSGAAKPPAAPVDTNAQETQRMLQSATAALDAGRYDEAIRTFEAVLLLEPAHAAAQRGLDRAKRAKAAEDAILKGKP